MEQPLGPNFPGHSFFSDWAYSQSSEDDFLTLHILSVLTDSHQRELEEKSLTTQICIYPDWFPTQGSLPRLYQTCITGALGSTILLLGKM